MPVLSEITYNNIENIDQMDDRNQWDSSD